MKMNNLNKENFFTEEWTYKFPLAHENFYRFIDEYMEQVNWKKLFNEKFIDLEAVDMLSVDITAPRFHDIPFELQFGIIIKWLSKFGKHNGISFPVTDEEANDFGSELLRMFKLIENFLDGSDKFEECDMCDGTGTCEGGETLETPCTTCNGYGTVPKV